MTNIHTIGLLSFICTFLIWNFFSASSAFFVSPDKIVNKNASIIRVLVNQENQIATYQMAEDNNSFNNDEAMKQAANKITSLSENSQGHKGTIEVPGGTWKSRYLVV
ncbi:hypothetical protein CN527_05415 [Bacillus cereus]|nr:hypothetical protein CN527_05415 [Bacillus cereus]PFA31976.1 hypothetical protein CN390_17185 [Bacillus cereus]PGN92176.1 hypothetical protein CN976_23850 [Bacillus cereus]